ncbi:MAG: hypothetical protein WCQ50_12050 [Spirochaetota bacterium]
MIVEIRDALAVRAIRPVDAALYLRSSGWSPQEVRPGRDAIWLRAIEGEEFEALLPMDLELRDYALRMGDLLAVLAATERRSQSEIYRDLLTITSDVMRMRIADPDLGDGSLPIEEHALIAQKTRDLVMAAACAATECRPVWPTRKPTQAVDHVRRVRIGQSEQGSFVVTVISKITPLLQTSEYLFEEEPYERKVTHTLASSLQALGSAAETAALTQGMQAFDEAVPRGVSANLCDAVVGLWGGDETERSLEFSFTWSPARPIDVSAPRRLAFSSDRIPVIREVGRVMRDRAPMPDFELRGAVVKLERGEGAPTGKVTVAQYGDEGPRRVMLELGDSEYHKAVQAHDQGKTFRAFGTLKKEGRGYILENPRDLGSQDE